MAQVGQNVAEHLADVRDARLHPARKGRLMKIEDIDGLAEANVAALVLSRVSSLGASLLFGSTGIFVGSYAVQQVPH